MLLMHLYGYPLPIIPHRYSVLFLIYIDLDHTRLLVPLYVIRSVYQYFIYSNIYFQQLLITEYFVEARDETDGLLTELILSLGENPHRLIGGIDTANVGVWSEEDVLDLSLFLVDFFNWLVH